MKLHLGTKEDVHDRLDRYEIQLLVNDNELLELNLANYQTDFKQMKFEFEDSEIEMIIKYLELYKNYKQI